MSGARSYLIDTNVLIHLLNQDSMEHETVVRSLELLAQQHADLVYTTQNLAEFWNVCTRPVDKNGFGLSTAVVHERATLIETRLRFIEDSAAAYRSWRKLIVEFGVAGVQVHDARLVAVMRVHSIDAILTYNLRDFRRFDGISALTPRDVLRDHSIPFETL